MKVTPFVHEGLGNSSYLVQLTPDSALLVDPDRGVRRYLRETDLRGLRIVGVLETHLHADFVTGSRELLELTGVAPHASRAGQVRFPHRGVAPGDDFTIEGIRVQVIGSPGHTPEHVSYVLDAPRSGAPALFSGGSLIVGGAARTDLIAPEATEELTRAQFRTLKDAFADLPDETLLYPTHGGGSFCSAGASSERTSTLGSERNTNPLMMFNDEDEFTRWFPKTFPGAPDSFFEMRPINQAGPRLRSEIADPPAISPYELLDKQTSGVVIDTRPASEYMRGHIHGAISIAFRPAYSRWLGWVVPLGAPLYFVTGDEPLEDVLSESLLVGHENFAGWLQGGISDWNRAGLPTQSTPSLPPARVRRLLNEGALALDVRERGEFEAAHVSGAINVPLGDLSDASRLAPARTPIIAYCGHGERSATGISLLERSGVEAWNLEGGFGAWDEGRSGPAID
jgi:glyoxylase-like metal-dependent hydrolase (beta-lactamase superfamily II)/rhodanese-related sulfurtransferase